MHKKQLPELRHIDYLRKVDVPEPLERAHYDKKGNHLFIGQRKFRGKSDALIYLGKCIESTRIGNKYDANVWLDIRTPHVVYIVGKRGSGKSYDLGIITEGLLLGSATKVSTKDVSLTTIIFDTQDQFWSLESPPSDQVEADREQLTDLKKWRLQPCSIPGLTLLKPRGEAFPIPGIGEFSIDPADLSIDDWCSLLQEERYTPIGQTIESLIKKVAHTGYTSISGGVGTASSQFVRPNAHFGIGDLLKCLDEDQDLATGTAQQTRNAVLWRLNGMANSSLFVSGAIDVRTLLKPGQLTVFLMRSLDNATKSIVVSVIAKKIFTVMGEFHTMRRLAVRKKAKMDAAYESLPEGAWLILDEAHLVCPADRDTSAKSVLIEYVKRGRDAGLSLVLATQQPSAIDSRVVSQVDLMIAHRLVMESDINAALSRMPASLPSRVTLGGQHVSKPNALVRILDTREAWIGDAESSRAFLVAMRPRVTAHGGDEPTLV